MPKKMIGYRLLTEEELTKVHRLLWRTTQAYLAKKVGFKIARLSQAIVWEHRKPLPQSMIDRLNALTLEDFEATRYRKMIGGYHPRRLGRGPNGQKVGNSNPESGGTCLDDVLS